MVPIGQEDQVRTEEDWCLVGNVLEMNDPIKFITMEMTLRSLSWEHSTEIDGMVNFTSCRFFCHNRKMESRKRQKHCISLFC